MYSAPSDGGKYDDLLTGYAKAIEEEGKSLSRMSLTRALHDQGKVSFLEARRVVDDFCVRGVVQDLFGPGPYDEWLTLELKTARRMNRGINKTALAKKLQRENLTYQAGMSRNRLLGLASAIDIVEDYLMRYGLTPVLGPYPLSGIVIVILAEALLFLPIF